MSFLDSDQYRKLSNQYLKKLTGASQRVYRSELHQFANFIGGDISEITRETLEAYRDKIASKYSSKTTKRKFSTLNGFFKFLEKKVNDFQNPIIRLNEFRTHKGVKSDELKKYLDSFIATLNTSNTRKTYTSLAMLFFSWSNKDLSEITQADILAYINHLKISKNKDSTVWTKIVALNRFLTFVERQNRKFKNPIVFKELKLIVPKKDKGYYSVLSVNESERFLKQANRKTSIGKRDYAMLLITLVYGLRANEVAKLRHRDLEPERVKGQQKVWIRDRKGKFQNRPETAIILNGRALQAFDAWIAVVKADGVKINGDLPIFLPFIYDRGTQGLIIRRDRLKNPLSVKAIENVVQKYIVKAKIKREGAVISPHALRHTAFTNLAQAGISIQDIQKLAGHQDINTTMIYVHAAQSYDDHPGLHAPLNK